MIFTSKIQPDQMRLLFLFDLIYYFIIFGLCQWKFQKLLYNNYPLSMLRKFHLNKIQCCKYTAAKEHFQELNCNFEQLLLKTIKTPSQRHQMGELQIMKTQKLHCIKRSESNCGLHQSRKKLQPLNSNQLPELVLNFKSKNKPTCQTDRANEKKDFLIRRTKNTSFSHIHNDKSIEQPDQSMEKDYMLPKIGNEKNQRQHRAKGKSKYQQACKIVQTKKLPFHLCNQNKSLRKGSIASPDWNVSIILKKDEIFLPSLDSYKELGELL